MAPIEDNWRHLALWKEQDKFL